MVCSLHLLFLSVCWTLDLNTMYWNILKPGKMLSFSSSSFHFPEQGLLVSCWYGTDTRFIAFGIFRKYISKIHTYPEYSWLYPLYFGLEELSIGPLLSLKFFFGFWRRRNVCRVSIYQHMAHVANPWLCSLTLWVLVCACSVAKSCLTLCDPMDHSPPGSSVHGSSQARILEWIAVSFSRGSSQSRDRTQVSYID